MFTVSVIAFLFIAGMLWCYCSGYMARNRFLRLFLVSPWGHFAALLVMSFAGSLAIAGNWGCLFGVAVDVIGYTYYRFMYGVR